MDPIITGSLISAGANLLGGAIGGGGDGFDVSENLAYTRKKYKAAVQGAKAAGLHPLFALGAGGAGSPVTTIPGQSNTGSHIAEAGRMIGGAISDKALKTANVRAVNAAASRDEALAAEALSRTKRLETEGLSSGGLVPGQEVKPGIVKPMPSEQISAQPGSPGVQAGQHSFFKEYVLGKIGNQTIKVWGPASDEPAEAFENVGGMIVSIPKNIYELAKWSTDPYARLIRRLYLENKERMSKKPYRQTRRGRRYR